MRVTMALTPLQFADGDVKVNVIPDTHCLHSRVLKSHSRSLEQLLGGFCPSVTPLSSTKQSEPQLRRIITNVVGSSAHKYGILEIQVNDLTYPIAKNSQTKWF